MCEGVKVKISGNQMEGHYNIGFHESSYREQLPSFYDEVERVRDVFTDGKSFDSLTKRLGSLTPKDWKDNQPRDVIFESLDALVEFCK